MPLLSAYDFGVIRSPGPGLGNLMFPIARALIGRQRYGGTFVAPTIRQFKLGPILRNEPDKRTYSDVFAHRTLSDWRNRFAARLARRVSEDDFTGAPAQGVAVTYSGLRNYFHDLAGSEALVGPWFKSKAQRRGTIDAPYDIAVHVRLGDFAVAQGATASGSVRQSFDWYKQAIALARQTLGGSRHRIVMFTDASKTELQPLVSGLDAEFDPGANALTSMLNMSEARIIVTSRSTFSMWAAYLGGAPAIWDAAFDLSQFFPERDGLDIRVGAAP